MLTRPRLVSCVALLMVLELCGTGRCPAFERVISLVTKQPLGELAVAGRLSIDLHAEFMVAREYETETVLNWYNCGYSGGGGEGARVTKVGGDFGDFGFQVPFQEREKRYPHAVTVNQVRAVRFDGNQFMKGNFSIEKKILEGGRMALEVWFRANTPAPGDVLLGWQSLDGKDVSAPLTLPDGFKGSDAWRHLLLNCTPEKEDWYLDGVKLSSVPRRTVVKEGHVLVLGGASVARPSFKGDLAAVRLHDAAMTDEQIEHNAKGGVLLGTEMHNWWRTEPDKWWVKESEHFRHAVDKAEMAKWSAQQLKEFNERVPRMFDMAELIYHTYSERHALRSSVVSRRPEMRGDGIKYKIPIQPSNGSWMGVDDNFGWACQGAGHINPHELVHGWDAMTGGMQGNYWEVNANFPQTYNGIYQTNTVDIVRSSMFFPAHGWNYYHCRLMFEHLAQTPEYGPMFVSKLWYDGPTASDKDPYPWTTFSRVNPYPERTLADEWTRMAMRTITWDYKTFKERKPGETGNTPYGNDAVLSEENLYAKEWRRLSQDRSFLRDARVLLEKIPYDPEWWRVPKPMAPQQLGWNVCPLTCPPGTVTATLTGYVDAARGGDWRAALVGVDASGKPVYGGIFGPGKTQVFEVKPELKELYLVVSAVPTKLVKIDMVGDFRSFDHEQFPYKVKLTGCEPLDILRPEQPKGAGAPHPNGGGFVEKSAQVEASVYVGPNAQVLGKSKVLGSARIEDYAVVQNATVKDHAVLSGYAMVTQDSVVAEYARVRDFGEVRNHSTVKGCARILEHASVHSGQTCGGYAVAKGMAHIYGGNQSGTALFDGSYAKGNEVTQGKWFTWSWGQGKNAGEIDEEFHGLYADYDFSQEHGWMARDIFGVTWGYLVHQPAFLAVADDTVSPASPAPVKHALALNGQDQFVELQKDLADMGDCTYTLRFKWEGGPEAQRLFEFAHANGAAVSLSPSENGKLVFALGKGKTVEQLSAPSAKPGVWTTVQVIIEGARASLYVDGKQAAENRAITLKPEDIHATQCYLGRGLSGGYFRGQIGRFTVHSVPQIKHTPPSPDPAAFRSAPVFVSPGLLVMAATVGHDPLGSVEYLFEEEGGKWNSGWMKDPSVRIENKEVTQPARYRVKMRDKCGNETQYSEFVLSAGLGKQFPLYTVTPDAPAVIEAEHFSINTPSLNGACKWEFQTQPPGFVGKGFMAVPDRGVVNEPFSDAATRLDYALGFAKPGRYYLWVRAHGNNDGGASIHAGLGLRCEKWGRNIRTGFGRWAWTRAPAFQVAVPGEYLFSVWMREDGAMLDRFIITADEKFEPSPDQRAPDHVQTGNGPAETQPLRPQ